MTFDILIYNKYKNEETRKSIKLLNKVFIDMLITNYNIDNTFDNWVDNQLYKQKVSIKRDLR